MSESSSRVVLLIFFLRALCATHESVEVMYMDTITTHMSMHSNNMWVAVGRSNVAVECGVGAWCRGMLARGGSGGPGVPRTYGDAHGDGAPEAAGTSHSRGRRGGRHVEGGSSSETD